jgi:hypothetical protein
MGAIHRHTHTRHTRPKLRMMHNLPAFVLHLHLLFRITRRQKRIHLRQNIKRDLMRIHLPRHRLPRDDLPHLRAQLLNRLRSRPRHCLITRSKNSRDMKRLMQRIKRHQRNRRGAIRIRDNPLVQLHIPRINLRHHQRHLRIHPKRARIIHHHTTRRRRNRPKLPRNIPPGAKQRDIDALERVLC